jgi:mono/diheme cytochrome c family protein
MSTARKRLLLAGLLVIIAVTFVELMAYDIIKLDWLSFMEVQASYKPMEDPLPVATGSVPVDGAVNLPGVTNPIPADGVSVERGRLLYSVTCIQCHGPKFDGNGLIAGYLANQPADLTGNVVQSKVDSELFAIISNGVVIDTTTNGVKTSVIRMPALNENLTVRDRWDLVNFIRSLKGTAPQATPSPTP